MKGKGLCFSTFLPLLFKLKETKKKLFFVNIMEDNETYSLIKNMKN